MNEEKKINIVLAGQGNVGKSAIFNYLTGLHQHIGNWAGKTIEKFEGTLFYHGFTIDVLDLPGIYSLTTFSVEEVISREYIIYQRPDCVINIIDSTNLERNLIFTLQLLELECPIIPVLNMTDLAKKKGILIDYQKLQGILNTPVIPTVASQGSGLTKIIDKVIELKGKKVEHKILKYGKEIEDCISELSTMLQAIPLPYPLRWIAIKLLEKDKDVTKLLRDKKPEVLEKTKQLCEKLEEIHGHDSSLVIADERSNLAYQITREIETITHRKISLSDKL
ncbi:MAG: FeoB small GTPase domain-containing protein, partial [Bacteroidota bacterium]|nr:FeoB small GTPase domain-containing protein [Bacteroidota bacterium]